MFGIGIMVGVLLIIFGIAILYSARQLLNKVEKAQFERRNSSGMEVFKDYDECKKIKTKELFIILRAKTLVFISIGVFSTAGYIIIRTMFNWA